MTHSNGTTNGASNGGISFRKCSLCGKPYDPDTVKSRPFCSRRCQQIDLGNWLQEAYGLPTECELQLPLDDEPDEESEP